MKKTLITTVSLALLTASVGSMAHMPFDQVGAAQPGPGHPAMLTPEMRALQEDMLKKMAEAKTPEERQALMSQQQEKIREKMPAMSGAHLRGQMGSLGQMGGMGPMARMGGHGMRGHGMSGMPGMHGMGSMGNMDPHRWMMQQQRPQSGG